MGMTSVPKRSDEEKKDRACVHRTSPIRKEPQNETRAIVQKHYPSFGSDLQELLSAWPSSLRRGMLMGL